MEYTLKRLLRRPWITLLRLLLGATLCLLLGILSRYRADQAEQLADIKQSFEILCVVTNRKGTQAEALRMPPITMSALTGEDTPLAPYIRDLRMVKEFEISAPELGLDRAALLGVTNERCAEDLDPARGGEVHLLREDFYENDAPLALVSRAVYERLEEDTLALYVTDPYVDRRAAPELGYGKIDFSVAGWYSGSGSTIYLPFPAAARISAELSGRVTCDAASFLVADNETLEELRRAACGSFGSVDPQASPDADPRYALVIHDEAFRATLAATEQNLRQADLLLPLVALLSLGAGGLLCFLTTRGEAKVYALMRTLGQTKGRLLAGMLAEQLLPPALAAVVVGAVLRVPIPAGIFLGCHALGALVAGIRMIRVQPTAILREQE